MYSQASVTPGNAGGSTVCVIGRSASDAREAEGTIHPSLARVRSTWHLVSTDRKSLPACHLEDFVWATRDVLSGMGGTPEALPGSVRVE